ncbi:MAG: hypothetical protein K8R37_03330 [Bacteroidales bacterium]|nr:hypothetical protein [Bacteroidales bacterium]
MKKLGYLLGLMLIAGMVFTSCKKDDDEPEDLKPSIAFKTSGDYISSDVTLNQGESILVGVLCSSNQNSGKKLTNFKIYMIINNVTQPAMVDSSGFSEGVFEANYTITFPDVLDGKLYAEITDKDGQKNSLSFNVTVESAGDPVSSNLNVTMGSFNDNDFGSFYSTSNHTIYFKAEAENNQELIDFAFFKGGSTLNTIAATAAQNVKDVFQLNWTTYNDTKIGHASIDAAEFDAIGDTYQFPEFTGTENEVNALSEDDVLIFKTVEGKIGFIKVNNFNGKGDKINIDVKVRQ